MLSRASVPLCTNISLSSVLPTAHIPFTAADWKGLNTHESPDSEFTEAVTSLDSIIFFSEQGDTNPMEMVQFSIHVVIIIITAM